MLSRNDVVTAMVLVDKLMTADFEKEGNTFIRCKCKQGLFMHLVDAAKPDDVKLLCVMCGDFLK